MICFYFKSGVERGAQQYQRKSALRPNRHTPVIRHAQLSASVEELCGPVARATGWGMVAPQDTISPSRGSALLAGVPVVAEHVVLVRRRKVGQPLFEALERLKA